MLCLYVMCYSVNKLYMINQFTVLLSYPVLNSLSPGRYSCDFKFLNFKHKVKIGISSIQVDITLETNAKGSCWW